MCDKTYGTHLLSNDEEDLELQFKQWIDNINEQAKLIDEIKSLKIVKLKVRPDIYEQWNADCNIVHSKNKLDTIFGIKLEIDSDLKEPTKFIYKGDED